MLWRQVRDNPHVIGDFTWTGWDYLGEAGIGRRPRTDERRRVAAGPAPYPWLAAWCGDIDITGHRRPASYYREIVFGLRPRSLPRRPAARAATPRKASTKPGNPAASAAQRGHR